MLPSHPNFLSRPPRAPRILQTITLVSVLGAVAMTGLLLQKAGSSGLRADIGNQVIGQSSGAGLGNPAPKTPKLLGSSAISSIAIGLSSDTIRYTEQGSGKGFSVDLRTRVTSPLIDTPVVGFVQRWWADQSKAFLQVATLKGVTSYQASSGEGSLTTLGRTISAVAISPDGHHISFIDTTEGSQYVVVTDIDGSAAHKLLPTRAQGARLSWLGNNLLLLLSRDSTTDSTDMTAVSMTGDLQVIEVNRPSLQYVASPDHSHLLVSYTGSDGSISLLERSVNENADVPLGVATSADKCAWGPDGTFVVCGVPHTGQISSAAPADHTATNDDIIRLDLRTGDRAVLYQAQQKSPVGVIRPLVSSSGTFLVFTNIFDSKLYELEL